MGKEIFDLQMELQEMKVLSYVFNCVQVVIEFDLKG